LAKHNIYYKFVKLFKILLIKKNDFWAIKVHE
jgi:hypothetical protein